MTRLEMVEKIREKTGVTYEEARQSLEKTDWDMLDAIVALEHAKADGNAAYAYAKAPEGAADAQTTEAVEPRKRVVRHAGDAGEKIAVVLKWIGNIIRKGEQGHVEVIRKEETIMSLSVTTIILLLLLCWWLIVLLVAAGLFTGYRFRFVNVPLIGRAANAASEKASDKAEEIKNRMYEDENP